jgi:hypothetical protein
MILFASAILIFIILTSGGYKDIINTVIYSKSTQSTEKENADGHVAYAHFFGATKTVGNYQIVFQPFPFVPFVGDNSTTLNFSILDSNNSNVNNVYAALIIKEKNTGSIVGQIPYKFYEFSDITFRYPFQNVGNYVVTFEAKINGDPKYQDSPLTSNFDISVSNLRQIIPFDQLMLYYVTPSTAALAGIVIYIISRKRTSTATSATNKKHASQ